MHKVQPNQKVRILTLQIAVPESARPSRVADELSEMLTGAIADRNSHVLDWQYVLPHGGPETSNIVMASAAPEEGEVFLDDVLTAVTFAPDKRYQLSKQDVLLSADGALMLIHILSKVLEKGYLEGGIPDKILLTLFGARISADFQPAIDAGIVVRATTEE
jgi:hypothetical protein